MIMRSGPRGDKNKRWGLRAPAALWIVPRRFSLRHLQAADCQIPGLLNIRLPVSALYDVALRCRKRIALTVTLEYHSGVKQSGIGRELGQYALSAYTNAKAVHGK